MAIPYPYVTLLHGYTKETFLVNVRYGINMADAWHCTCVIGQPWKKTWIISVLICQPGCLEKMLKHPPYPLLSLYISVLPFVATTVQLATHPSPLLSFSYERVPLLYKQPETTKLPQAYVLNSLTYHPQITHTYRPSLVGYSHNDDR